MSQDSTIIYLLYSPGTVRVKGWYKETFKRAFIVRVLSLDMLVRVSFRHTLYTNGHSFEIPVCKFHGNISFGFLFKLLAISADFICPKNRMGGF